MTTVVGLTHVRNGPLVDVVLAGGESVRVHQRRIAASALGPGSELGPESLAALRRAAVVDRCEQRALRLLGIRARSSEELRGRLATWGLTDDEAGHVVGRLERLGLVDDPALAQAIRADHLRRGFGRLRTRSELERRGMDAIAHTLEPDGTSAVEQARALLNARLGEPPWDLAARRRGAGLLARRGFDDDTVAGALERDTWS
jgi:regulatory protein